jgi:hypothetical protein
MRSIQFFVLAVATVAIAACKSDSTGPGDGAGTPPIVYTLTVDTTLKDSINATVATTVPVRVQLTKAGAPVAGGIVTWTSTLGSGKVSSDSTATDANGNATILWTLGDTAGYNTLSIASFDATTVYHAVGLAGEPTNLVRVSEDSTAVVAGAALALSVRAIDRLGNGAGTADIQWSATGGDIFMTPTPAGTNGGATTVFTTPETPGTYSVTATLPGHASVTFKIVAL